MRKPCWWGLAILVMIFSAPQQLRAAEPPSLYGPAKKLGRGAANMLTAPLELFREPALISERDGRLAGATVGMARGIVSAIVRELVGAFEVLTFFSSFPNAYKPIVEPEFVYANGDWQP